MMTTDTTDTPPQPAAVGAQVQRSVRPDVWKCGECGNTSNAEGIGENDNWCGACGACHTMQPRYDQAALDAAVAAERERWMRLVRERLDATVMSCYASTKECEAARAALRGVMVYENAA